MSNEVAQIKYKFDIEANVINETQTYYSYDYFFHNNMKLKFFIKIIGKSPWIRKDFYYNSLECMEN